MIRTIIVDDEPKAVVKLAKQLEMSGIVEIKGTFISPIEALEAVKHMKIDAAFIDIEMPGMDGLSLANQILDIDGQIAVVFITAYNEYAAKAFRINAIDYILKPADTALINETLERIVKKQNIEILESELKVNCLGKFKVIYENSGEEIRWRTKKAEEIFAYLVDSRGKDVSKDELLEKVFGEFDSDNAYNYLKTSIHYIKKTFAAVGMDGLVISIKGGYKLDIKKIKCDYYEFTNQLSEHPKIDDESIAEYESLVNLYIGGYLEGNFYSWAEEKLEKHRETYIKALIDIGDYYRGTGHYTQCINILRKGLKVDSLSRELNKNIIESYIAQKDRLAAVKHYDSYKRKLKSEFGLEIDEDIKKILK